MRSIEKKAGNRSFGAKASGGVSGGATFISRETLVPRARVTRRIPRRLPAVKPTLGAIASHSCRNYLHSP